MFSWITGPRITNVIEDLQTEPNGDTTFLDGPETPAPTFAVKAFKQAIFGTPAQADTAETARRSERKVKLDTVNAKVTEFTSRKEPAPLPSPSKPNGILATPGTGKKGLKSVSFGPHVVDNEDKRPNNASRSGIPSNCPGKFPSPWTPGTELRTEAESDKKPRTKLTAALYDARSTAQPRLGQKPKARDDSDITMDFSAPRSESGKYWKEQYESYADKSEKEMKKLVAKQQVSKNFAKKKDGEATELATRLAEERKRFRSREIELEQQNKEYQERLRQSMAENARAGVEIAALKSRIENLGKSFTAPSSDIQESKPSFQIYEDPSKDSLRLKSEQGKGSKITLETSSTDLMGVPPIILGKSTRTVRKPIEDKENSPPKPRRLRRKTLPDGSARDTPSHSVISSLGDDSGRPAATVEKPSFTPTAPPGGSTKPTLADSKLELPSIPPLSARQVAPGRENMLLKSPAMQHSSPLPQGSPDIWAFDDNPLPQMDRMALPFSTAPSYSKPPQTSRPLHAAHRVSKSVSQSTKSVLQQDANHSKYATDANHDTTKPISVAAEKTTEPERPASRDTHNDASNSFRNGSTRQQAEGPSQVAGGSNKIAVPADRKEMAIRRLVERRKRKAPAGGYTATRI